jgi:hypothetical protein
VTLAVGALETEGAIRRLGDGSWLLTDVARRKVEAIIADSGSVTPHGESFMLRSEAQALRGEARQTRARGQGVSEEPCKRDRKDWSCLHRHRFIQI